MRSRTLALLLLFAGTGESLAQAPRLTVTGTVSYRDRQVIPDDATLRLRLIEVGPRGSLGLVVAERVISATGRLPIRFELPYDRPSVSRSKSYAVDARVEAGQRELYVPSRLYFVLTSGRPAIADLVLRVPADSAARAPPLPETEATVIESIVRDAHHPMLRWPRLDYYDDELLSLYEVGTFVPLWLERGRVRPQARHAIDGLLAADTRGLDPRDYDAPWLDSLARAMAGGSPVSTRDRAMFDAALSVGLLRYLSDLHIGRVNPQSISIGINVERRKVDLAPLIREAIAADRIGATIAAAEPSLLQYRRLIDALATYKRIARDTSLRLVPWDSVVHPGSGYTGATKLRHRLAVLGDLPAEHANSRAYVYDSVLVDAVKHFQARNGLAADGILGKATISRLNTPIAQRVHQIELALERLRWLPALDRGRFILVNIPSFQLWAFDTLAADEKPSLRMNVIVGEAARTETPLFEGDLRYIELRPYWNVTPNIGRSEVMPRALKDSTYLARNHYELVRGTQVVPPTRANIARLKNAEVYARQLPGPFNALGPAKFIFPNDENIYLHGTPQQELFARTRRDFSHGCIRVEDPTLLAEWLLRPNGDWPRDRIVSAMALDRPTRATPRAPLPVVLFYATAVANPDGTLGFFDDIYRHDERLDKALLLGYPYPP
jgi:murein L,D-transpeptidase YcbB/YkuD